MTGKNFIPFPVLETGRLTLRQLKSSDDKEIFALRSNDSVNKYLGRKPSKSLDDARKFIGGVNENVQNNDSVYWAIVWDESDKLIGTVCLFGFTDDNSKAEVGYELLPDFQGKGIMQEVLPKVIDFGFYHIGLSSIEAYTHSENQNSIRLLEKLNFERSSAADENFMVFKLKRNR